ncbi:MAG TPA: DUF2786 domain-containing protein [Polyangiaceae bacterium]
MTEARKRLTVELEAAAVRAIFSTYLDLNATFFKRKLRRPTIELADTASRLGQWDHESRRIELSRALLERFGWGALVEVLKHEMAHQYTDEILGATDEAAHGPTFRAVCEERGFDARAAGSPGPGGPSAPTPILERIAKLLSLAESSNEHEAQSAMNAAQRLMLKHNIQEVTRGLSEACSFRHLGHATGRVSEAERLLANILSEHFFVDCIWVPVWRPDVGKRGSVLEICGRLENLEMAEYVYAFLLNTASRLWKEHRRAERLPGNRDRRAYVAGVVSGFRKQLEEQARRHAAEGLVWVGDAEIGRYFRGRHPHVRWTRHVSSRNSRAHQSGVEAGRRIVLHRGVKQGASGGIRLLAGRKA